MMTIKENKGIQMKETKIINNQVTLIGEITTNFEFSHNVHGEGFYTTMIANERTSGRKDIIPIMVSDRLVDVKAADWIGRFVVVSGQFRSYNKHDGEKNSLVLSVFVRELETWIEEADGIPDAENRIFLDGFICKPPIYRKTPLGREITDILLAANRPYGKSDYIPCICWGRNARFASNLQIGTRLRIEGRIQSREYQKKLSETEFEKRVAYEVSVSRIETVSETKGVQCEGREEN